MDKTKVVINGTTLDDIKELLYTGQRMAITTGTFEKIIELLEEKIFIQDNVINNLNNEINDLYKENDRYKQALEKIEESCKNICEACGNKDTKCCNNDCDIFNELNRINEVKNAE